MKLSIIICTYNRCNYLKLALESLKKQTADQNLYEIILVNNNSTDQTEKVSKAYSIEFRNFTYLFEPHPGLSHARNVGLAKAQSEIVAYLDDDAIASDIWVSSIIQAFGSGTEDLAVVGGKVDLLWTQEKPAWLHNDLLGWLGYLNLGNKTFLNPEKQAVYGCNMAFKKSYLVKAGAFNINLGIQGNKTFTNEEVEVQIKIAQLNGKVLYDPEISIQHHAKRDLTPAWFYDRGMKHGISVARSVTKAEIKPTKALLELAKTGKSFLKSFLKKQAGKISDMNYTSERVLQSYYIGYYKELLRIRFQ